MRVMYIVFIFQLLFGINSISGAVCFTPKSNKITGIYDYTATSAPLGYEKGIIEIKKVDKEWIVIMETANHEKRTGRYVKVKRDKVEFMVYLLGLRLTMNFTYKKDKLDGIILTYGGGMPIEAIKRKN